VKFSQTAIAGVWLVEPQPVSDERGFFARFYCNEEFSRLGLNQNWVQWSISFNRMRGTLRGLHLQVPPYEEIKLVRCTAGCVWDVVVDLRRTSETFMQSAAFTLSAMNRIMVYIPAGVAHGFITLEENTELLYFISEFHHPESARGFRWDDSAFGIEWPMTPSVISSRDCNHPDYRPRNTDA